MEKAQSDNGWNALQVSIPVGNASAEHGYNLDFLTPGEVPM